MAPLYLSRLTAVERALAPDGEENLGFTLP
jgi:hypothetical protein